MKKIVKALVFLLVILQILTVSSSTYAQSAVNIGNSVALYSKKTLSDIKMNYYGQDLTMYYTVYNDGNKEYPAYCVDYFHGGITDVKKYSVTITEDYINENTNFSTESNKRKLGVWRAIINGYPFVDKTVLNCANDYEAYAATKQAVFCMLYNRDVSLYTYTGAEGKRVYDAMVYIVGKARSSTKIPMNTNINLTETEWQIDKINSKYMSKEITLNCDTPISDFTVSLEGNVPKGTFVSDLKNNKLTHFKGTKVFKVLLPLEQLINEDKFKVKVEGNVISYPMYFGQAPSDDIQSYVLTEGALQQKIAGNLIQYPENKTKLIIKKVDKEGNLLAGVKFNILDENKNIVYKNLQTNENGIIELERVIPGKYYLQEIETIEGYEINSELIELKVEFNEEKTVEVENVKIPENKTKLIIKKVDKEGNVLAGVKFNILDENKNIVYENLQTNEDGIIEIEKFIPGKYYLQEIETIEGYEINSELIELKVEFNEEKTVEVENVKIPENKTKLIIKKVDKEGNLLAGVKFNILDENKNIVYENLQTNEDGIIEIEKFIPGKYYLQEIETIEGYEINSELIELRVDFNEEKEIVVENVKTPEEPEIPKVPEVPKIPEIPKAPEKPKLPRTGW